MNEDILYDDIINPILNKETISNTTPTNFMKTYDYENVAITDIVNNIIVDSINNKASDIHFNPTEDGIIIRIRIDGELRNYANVPGYVKKNMITRMKILAGMNITESRIPQDGAIKQKILDKDVDLRVSSLPTNMGENIVVRILDYSMSTQGLETLGFNDTNLKKIIKMSEQPNGIILVTGATGSGKSTTVYSVLQRLNTIDRNIITVEDPIEMNIPGINQVQVISDIGLTFAACLRSILRQDPDIIMIGEIRDDETAKIAVRASITGHLVLSTIHTNTALNTIERLLDMNIERYLLGTALTGIVSQKLCKKLCPYCRGTRPTTPYEKKVFKNSLNLDINEIYETKSCDKCHDGYKGRIAIHEVLEINQDIRDAITNNIKKEELRDLVYSSGTINMLQDGLTKVINGDTTFEELVKAIDIDDSDLTSKGLTESLEIAEKNKNILIDNENIKKIVEKNDSDYEVFDLDFLNN
ncbi:MAG: type II/IV secretion system protein [Bacilli bacterium]|nr:type II/IV secretion system protein [Bacilli bacterium]